MKSYYYNIAFFMILLVVSLPICASNSFAQVVSVRAYGQDKVFDTVNFWGYERPTDVTTFEALIGRPNVCSSGTCDVTVEGTPFTHCITVGQNSNCTVSIPHFGTPGNKYDYTVRYLASSAVGATVVDDQPPFVHLQSIQQNGRANVTLTYSVYETAFDGDSGLYCSNINKIEFLSNNNVIKTLNLNKQPSSNCGLGTTQTSISIGDPGVTSKNICIKATDNVNQFGQNCTVFTIDNDPPYISSMTIYEQNGPVSFIAPVRGIIPVTVKFNMNERSLVPGSMKADLSDLTEIPQQKVSYTNVPVNCVPENCSGSCTCSTAVIDMNMPNGGTVSAKVNARDAAGNIADTTLAYVTTQDNIPPELESLEAVPFNGKQYISANSNIITAKFLEAGSGLSQKKVFMDFSSLMTAPANTLWQPYECIQTGTEWTCKWVLNPKPGIRNGDEIPFTLSYPSQDDAGNLITGVQKSLVMDSSPPQLLTNTLTAASATTYPAFIIQEGDTIRVSVKINDTLPVIAWLDYSQITGKGPSESGVCSPVPEKGISTCEFGQSYASANAKAGLNQILPLTIADAVGNNVTYDLSVNVFAKEAVANRHWDVVTGDVSPAHIDRQTITFYDPFVYQTLHLTKVATQANAATKLYPLSIQVGACTGDDVTYLKGSPQIINYNPGFGEDVTASGGYELFLKWNLDRAAPPTSKNSISVTCPLKIITRVGSTQVSNVESEDVTVTVNYYNNPQGEMGSELQKEIDRLKDRIRTFKLLDTLQAFVDYSRVVCHVFQTVYAIITLASTLRDTFSIAAKSNGLTAAPFTAASVSLGSMAKATEKTAWKSWTKFINNYCKTINCQLMQNDWLPQSGFLGFLGDTQSVVNRWASYAGVVGTPGPSTQNTNAANQNQINPNDVGQLANNRPEDSLIWSILFICIPGIISNLQKYREIYCQYVICLKQVANGLPRSSCEELKSYEMCKYVFGQMFNLIPFANAISTVGQLLGDVLRNPLNNPAPLFNIVASRICDANCINPANFPGGCLACNILNFANLVIDVSCDLTGISIGGQKRCNTLGHTWDQIRRTTGAFCDEALR